MRLRPRRRLHPPGLRLCFFVRTHRSEVLHHPLRRPRHAFARIRLLFSFPPAHPPPEAQGARHRAHAGHCPTVWLDGWRVGPSVGTSRDLVGGEGSA